MNINIILLQQKKKKKNFVVLAEVTLHGTGFELGTFELMFFLFYYHLTLPT